jgi:hypothetical protein
MNNIKETQELAEQYESITLETIKESCKTYSCLMAAGKLTGFGTKSCTLCASVTGNCIVCIHATLDPMATCVDHYTYGRIANAKTPEELYEAFQARARYLKTLITVLLWMKELYDKTGKAIEKSEITKAVLDDLEKRAMRYDAFNELERETLRNLLKILTDLDKKLNNEASDSL